MPITFNTFDDPAALPGTTYAYGINDTGQIVGWYYDGSGNGGDHGFLLSGGTYTTLDYPGAISPSHGTPATFAYGINDLGQIVGTTWQGGTSFLFSDGTYTTSFAGFVSSPIPGMGTGALAAPAGGLGTSAGR